MIHPNADRSTPVSASTLRYARQRAGVSLRTAAERAGISRSTLSAYERGARTPSLDRLFGILEALGFAVRIELEPRVREKNGVPRGEELVQVIRLAEQFPPRDRPRFPFFPSCAVRPSATRCARQTDAKTDRGGDEHEGS